MRAVEKQVADGQETAKQQAGLLQVQADQLEVLRAQLDDQRAATAKQAEVLELQAAELRESLEERKQAAAQRRREQAAHVFLTEFRHPHVSNSAVIGGGTAYVSVTVNNNGTEPLYEPRLRWHLGSSPYGDPNPEGLETILPGAEAKAHRSFPADANLDVCGAALEFRDAAGVGLLRRSDGNLAPGIRQRATSFGGTARTLHARYAPRTADQLTKHLVKDVLRCSMVRRRSMLALAEPC